MYRYEDIHRCVQIYVYSHPDCMGGFFLKKKVFYEEMNISLSEEKVFYEEKNIFFSEEKVFYEEMCISFSEERVFYEEMSIANKSDVFSQNFDFWLNDSLNQMISALLSTRHINTLLLLDDTKKVAIQHWLVIYVIMYLFKLQNLFGQVANVFVSIGKCKMYFNKLSNVFFSAHHQTLPLDDTEEVTIQLLLVV